MDSNGPKQKSGQKILQIIIELMEQEPLGVTEIADRLDIAKSTAHYHLKTLSEEGYIINDGGKYRLSLRFLRIGELTRSRIPIYDVAKDEVEQIADETGELAILGVEEQGFGVYIHKSSGENAVDIDAPIGRFAHLHNRAYGKAILAHLEKPCVESILGKHGLPRTTDQTVTTPEALFDELKQIRGRGFAVNQEESIEGIHGVAVPILDNDGSVLGAISLAGPSRRLGHEKMTDEYADLLLKARNVIELNVHHREF